MKAITLKKGFRGGEISPRVAMQTDLPAYEEGCETMQNWISTLQGPARTRGGFQALDVFSATYGRIFPFPLTPTKGYIITVIASNIYINDPDGGIEQDQKILNWDLNAGATSWTYNSQGAASYFFFDGYCHLYTEAGGGVTDEVYIRQQIDLTAQIGVQQTVRIILRTGFSSTGSIKLRVGTTVAGYNYVNTTLSSDGTHTFTFTPTVAACYVQLEAIGSAAANLRYVDSVEVFTLVASGGSITGPWTNDIMIDAIQTKMRPGFDELYFVSQYVAPKVLAYNRTSGAWTFGTVAITSEPAEWAVNGYPGAQDFFEGRWWLGGIDTQEEDFWASKSSNIHDFTTGSLAADAMHYSLSRRGRIVWMESQKNLIIGTDNDEWIVTSEGGVVIPGDINAERQSDYGSVAGTVTQVGGEVIYISSDSKKIRAIEYEWTKSKLIARDITFLSEHITGTGVKHLHFAKSPDQLMWAETLVGTLVGCTYDPISKIASWHKHDTQGIITSACILKFYGVDQLWILVDRDDTGTNLVLELYDSDLKLDSYQHLNFATPTDSLTGLTNLASKTCQCIINDITLHADVEVSATGTATLDEEVNSVKIGLGYDATLKTLPLAEATKYTGTSRSLLKRLNKLWVRIYNSYKPKIDGRGGSTAVGPVTENIQVSLRGYDRESQIEIVQSLPFITEVSGLFGEVSQDKT